MSSDPVCELILAEAAGLGVSLAEADVVVLDDAAASGAELTAALAGRVGRLRVHCDSLVDERAAAVHAPDAVRAELRPETVAGADLVLLRLPKALGALAEYADLIARHAPHARIVAGGRAAHMTRSMNDTLATAFTRVSASRGRRKARVLHAGGPRPDVPARWPRVRTLRLPDSPPLEVLAHGAVFAGGRLDPGTRLLLATLAARGVPAAHRGADVLDLGCGVGVLAAVFARAGARTRASDVSAAAVASTRATATRNRLDVAVLRRDGLSQAGPLDLVVSNPPFHVGTARDSAPTLGFIAELARVLRPGGEFWAVWNSHLPYLAALRRDVGRTEVAAQNRHFTVTRTRRGGAVS